MTGNPSPRLRIGVDVLDRRELLRLVERPWFLRFSFAPAETALAARLTGDRRLEFLAGRFAAKEAVLKALGLGMFQRLVPRDICVDRAEHGAPVVRFLGPAAGWGLPPIALSIAHKRHVVAAVAISLPLATTDEGSPT